jgi:hypothetical protein
MNNELNQIKKASAMAGHFITLARYEMSYLEKE